MLIEEYRIESLLGWGGMGEVYLAKDLNLDRRVALKIIRGDVSGGRFARRFLDEAREAAKLEHRNVVRIYKAGNWQGRLYIVMQFVDGQNLSELMKSPARPGGWGLMARLISKAGQGLCAVHAKRLCHRDVKPSNIMISSEREVLLMDFGLVRSEDSSEITETGDILGTPPFMSPEQCRGEKVDFHTDIYSLGATLYAALAGVAPFQESQGSTLALIRRKADNGTPTPLRLLKPNLPIELCSLVEHAMAPLVNDRLHSARALVVTLESILAAHRIESLSPWDSLDFSFVRAPRRLRPGPAAATPAPPVATGAQTPNLLLPIVGAVLAAVVLIVLAGFAIVMAGRGTAGGTAAASSASAPSAPPAPNAEASTQPNPRTPTPPSPAGDRRGMVFVPAGEVQLGAAPEKLREFLAKHIRNPEVVDRLLTLAAQEQVESRRVDAFWIDDFEVTNNQYAEFVSATSRRAPPHWSSGAPPAGKGDHPVVHVLYADAAAYAAWAGKKLPTREQWLRAYRGDKDWLLPWGDDYTPLRANVDDNPQTPADTTPVADTSSDVSEMGVHNLVGNACEFIRDPFVLEGQAFRPAKGGAFNATGFVYGIAPMQFLYGEDVHEKGLGFRCVAEQGD
jgi:serine/threonine protein kinase